MMYNFKFLKNLFSLFLILTIVPLFTKGNNSYNSDSVHYRNGCWDHSRLYKFNNVAESVGYLTFFPMDEIKQKVSNEILENWNIEYRLFTSIEDAELAMVEYLDMSSLLMFNIIDYPINNLKIGNNCWHQLSIGFIQFLRNNVSVVLSPKTLNPSSDSSKAVWLAQKIDSSLIESEKVDDVSLIPSPIIDSVEILSELPKSWDDVVDVMVNARNPNSQKLFFREYAIGFAIISETGQMTLTLHYFLDSRGDTNKAMVKIWVWNEDFITSSVYAEIPLQLTNISRNMITVNNTFQFNSICPNPFTISTKISYTLFESQKMMLTIYNIIGIEIATLINKFQSPGEYYYYWYGYDLKGSSVPSGVYFIQLKGDKLFQTERICLLK